MLKALKIDKQKLIYLLPYFLLIWMIFSITFCYEMGKHGLGDIDWAFVLKSCFPAMLITGSFIISTLITKTISHENS